MATIKIGDKVCSFQPPQTILQVALENGIEIPHYCYHPGLSIAASCRICLAEVAQPNPKSGALEKIPKLVPTCQQMAVDKSEVYIDSAKTVANQKAVMEYLLVNHPLDCPVCDQAGECYLQDYSYQYGRASSRFEETKVKQPKKDIGDHVLLYSDRCIMCSRCVRFTREVTGTAELGVTQRGSRSEIDVFPGRPLNNELSGNVVDICPVGALLDKNFLFEQRVWYLKSVPSIDPITCSGDNLWIDHNKGRIWRLKPRTNLDVNKWWTSDEIRHGWKFVHSDQRLAKPLLRQSEAKWHDALTAAASGLKKAVDQSQRVGALISPMLSCEEAYHLAKTIRAIDPGAILGIGPVPVSGQDKTFPGGYTVYAEKAPNARGVRRMLKQVPGADPLSFEEFFQKLKGGSEKIGAVLLTGNYPNEWANRPLIDALSGKFTVLIDTLQSLLTNHADVVLPSATWAEKSGTFENVQNRLQIFEQAIPVIEFARPEGQIALDLLSQATGAAASVYCAAGTRKEIGGELADLKAPEYKEAREPEMAFVEL